MKFLIYCIIDYKVFIISRPVIHTGNMQMHRLGGDPRPFYQRWFSYLKSFGKKNALLLETIAVFICLMIVRYKLSPTIFTTCCFLAPIAYLWQLKRRNYTSFSKAVLKKVDEYANDAIQKKNEKRSAEIKRQSEEKTSSAQNLQELYEQAVKLNGKYCVETKNLLFKATHCAEKQQLHGNYIVVRIDAKRAGILIRYLMSCFVILSPFYSSVFTTLMKETMLQLVKLWGKHNEPNTCNYTVIAARCHSDEIVALMFRSGTENKRNLENDKLITLLSSDASVIFEKNVYNLLFQRWALFFLISFIFFTQVLCFSPVICFMAILFFVSKSLKSLNTPIAFDGRCSSHDSIEAALAIFYGRLLDANSNGYTDFVSKHCGGIPWKLGKKLASLSYKDKKGVCNILGRYPPSFMTQGLTIVCKLSVDNEKLSWSCSSCSIPKIIVTHKKNLKIIEEKKRKKKKKK